MFWYVAAAWGALGGFAMKLFGLVRVAIRYRRHHGVPSGIDRRVIAVVFFVHALFGALTGIAINIQIPPPLPPYALIAAGIVANYLLIAVARSVDIKHDEERASRVKSEAEFLDSVRKPDRAPKGISPDVDSILAARRLALADQLPLAANEGGDSS